MEIIQSVARDETTQLHDHRVNEAEAVITH